MEQYQAMILAMRLKSFNLENDQEVAKVKTKQFSSQIGDRDRLNELNESGSLDFNPKKELFTSRITSSVWERFHVILDRTTNNVISGFVKCIECGHFVEYNGSTTSNLKNHKCNRKKIEQNHLTRIVRKFHQSDIEAVRNASVKFVVEDLRPFLAIEGEGMLDLLTTIAQIGSRYPQLSKEEINEIIPSRRIVKRHAEIKAKIMTETIVKLFRETLGFPGGFTCTVDICTEMHTHTSYLGMTSHLAVLQDNKIARHIIVFHCNIIKKTTGDDIYNEIVKVFETFNVQQQEIDEQITFLSDRGKNMINALSKSTRLNCYAHLINNLVRSMCQRKKMVDIVSKACSLVRYWNMSSLKNFEGLHRKLKQMCETRFNTVHTMLQSICDNYDDVSNALYDKERNSNFTLRTTQQITCLPKNEITLICKFLETFTTMTARLEGDQYPIHMVWPIFRKIQSHLQPKDSDITAVADMKQKGLKYFNENASDFEPTMHHKSAVFLHPMMKNMNFAPLNTILDVRQFIHDSINTIDSIANSEAVVNEGTSEMPSENNDSIFEEFLNEYVPQAVPSFSNELQRYIDFKVDMVSLV